LRLIQAGCGRSIFNDGGLEEPASSALSILQDYCHSLFIDPSVIF